MKRVATLPPVSVFFLPRRVAFCMCAAGLMSLWSTRGRVHWDRGLVEFRG